MSSKLCSLCEISLNFQVNKVPGKFDLKKVPNDGINEILREILENNYRLMTKNKFIIMVDEARYGIEVCKIEKGTIYLKQYVLHYNGRNLVPVYVRFVRIKQ